MRTSDWERPIRWHRLHSCLSLRDWRLHLRRSSAMFGGVHAEVDQTLRAAMEHHKAGRFRDAEALYRKVLSRDPQNADALHLLGVIAFQMNRPDMAAELIARAIQVDPSAAEFHKDMGNAMRGLGRIDDAVACQRRALELRPDFGEAHFNLGNLYQSQ